MRSPMAQRPRFLPAATLRLVALLVLVALFATGCGRNSKKDADEANRTFLHRGLAERSFERRFQLADHIKVTDAELANGLLAITLTLEIPEAKKPKTIAIKTAPASDAPVLQAAE